MQLSSDEIKLIQAIFETHTPRVIASIFGSRASGHSKPFSDIDILLQCPQPLSASDLFKLRVAFSESDLVYSVDLVQECDLESSYRETVLAEAKQVYPGKFFTNATAS